MLLQSGGSLSFVLASLLLKHSPCWQLSSIHWVYVLSWLLPSLQVLVTGVMHSIAECHIPCRSCRDSAGFQPQLSSNWPLKDSGSKASWGFWPCQCWAFGFLQVRQTLWERCTFLVAIQRLVFDAIFSTLLCQDNRVSMFLRDLGFYCSCSMSISNLKPTQRNQKIDYNEMICKEC